MIRLNDEFLPSKPGGPAKLDVDQLRLQLLNGGPAEKQEALLKLVAIGAEAALTECLRSEDQITVQFATEGLWECWLNEHGPKARQRLERGIKLMEAGDLAEAERIFLGLMDEFPKWAEAINREATLLHVQGKAAESLALCRRVVEQKPNHFGAWNGMALCAVQMEDWKTALIAASEAIRLQPRAHSNREIIKLAKAKLSSGEGQ